MKWYSDILANVPEHVRFSSARVGDYRVSLARTDEGRFGLAVCSPNDGFNRKQGQAIAYTRLRATDSKFRGCITDPVGAGGGENAIFAATIAAATVPNCFPAAFLASLEEEVAKLEARISTRLAKDNANLVTYK